MRPMIMLTAVTMFLGGLGGASSLVLADAETKVGEGATVVFEYTISVPESKLVIPKNVGQFVPGKQEMLPNLEKALTGMKQGEEKRVDLSSDEAFGPYDASKKTVMSKDRIPADTKPGTVLTTQEGVPFVVVDVSGPEAQVDFNHPLAGQHVVIDVKILDVQPPASGIS